MLYLVKSNENEVKYIDLRKNWNKQNDKFNEKRNTILVI
jgi:hypothetical protein